MFEYFFLKSLRQGQLLQLSLVKIPCTILNFLHLKSNKYLSNWYYSFIILLHWCLAIQKCKFFIHILKRGFQSRYKDPVHARKIFSIHNICPKNKMFRLMNSDWKKNGEFIHTRNPASRASKRARLVAMYIATQCLIQ